MANPKSTSVKTLARLRAERTAFDARERKARRAAAIELGEAVLKAADLALEPAQVAILVETAMKHGFGAAMALLAPGASALSGRKTAPNASLGGAANHVA